jgi:hypothetical protein
MEERLSDFRNERDYLRGSLDGYRQQIDKLYAGIQRRDWIEAKEKKLDQ